MILVDLVRCFVGFDAFGVVTSSFEELCFRHPPSVLVRSRHLFGIAPTAIFVFLETLIAQFLRSVCDRLISFGLTGSESV